jgi:uroporphyrin-III C-methyltransferase/precorrin-2 dehydrogenase/sirohydrochlorin ferrochelatase
VTSGYPLLLHVSGRRAIVVGAGQVATRRAAGLVGAGAEVTVIAPNGTETMEQLALTWHRRAYREGDLTGAWLVHAATDDPQVNELVAADAERRGIWCVRADDAAASAAWVPAVVRSNDLVIAVNATRDPRRARALRDAVQERLEDIVAAADAQAARRVD